MGGPTTAAGAKLGRYQIVKHLASGGMAEVLLARATGIEGFTRHVVIKRIRPGQAKDQAFVQMFLNEARIAAQLHHANIVQVHDIGQEGNEYFFAMEYVHGEDLRRLLTNVARNRQKVPLEHVVTIICAAAVALHHAHEQRGPDRKPLGIVHRDVTPANILVGYDGNVKVVDFGIAKAAVKTEETQAGVLKGKASYMSPEQCTGSRVDRRSDVFALGIVLYELVTARRLFKADNDFLTMSAIVAGKVPPARTHRPDLPEALEAIIMKALAVKPEDRYQTADEMREALEQFAADAGLRTSTSALAAYMKQQFGERPEPWLVEEDDLEVEVVVDFDGSASAIVSPPDESVNQLEIPSSVDAVNSSPIVKARTKAITNRPAQRKPVAPAAPKRALPLAPPGVPGKPLTAQIPTLKAVPVPEKPKFRIDTGPIPVPQAPRRKPKTVQIPTTAQVAATPPARASSPAIPQAQAPTQAQTPGPSSGVPEVVADVSDSEVTTVADELGSAVPRPVVADIDDGWDMSLRIAAGSSTGSAPEAAQASRSVNTAAPSASPTSATAASEAKTPTSGAAAATGVDAAAEVQAAGEAKQAAGAQVRRDATPTPNSKPRSDATPTPIAKARGDATPIPSPKPRTDATPTPGTKPRADATPIPSPKPRADVTPVPSTKPRADATPTPMAKARADATPPPGTKPRGDATPIPRTKPRADATPTPISKAHGDATPTPGMKPRGDATPIPITKPRADATPPPVPKRREDATPLPVSSKSGDASGPHAKSRRDATPLPSVKKRDDATPVPVPNIAPAASATDAPPDAGATPSPGGDVPSVPAPPVLPPGSGISPTTPATAFAALASPAAPLASTSSDPPGASAAASGTAPSAIAAAMVHVDRNDVSAASKFDVASLSSSRTDASSLDIPIAIGTPADAFSPGDAGEEDAGPPSRDSAPSLPPPPTTRKSIKLPGVAQLPDDPEDPAIDPPRPNQPGSIAAKFAAPQLPHARTKPPSTMPEAWPGGSSAVQRPSPIRALLKSPKRVAIAAGVMFVVVATIVFAIGGDDTKPSTAPATHDRETAPTKTPGVEPATTEPATAEPATAEPTTTEAATTEPADDPTDSPAPPAQPDNDVAAPVEPAPATKPAITKTPATKQPAVKQPVTKQPTKAVTTTATKATTTKATTTKATTTTKKTTTTKTTTSPTKKWDPDALFPKKNKKK